MTQHFGSLGFCDSIDVNYCKSKAGGTINTQTTDDDADTFQPSNTATVPQNVNNQIQ